MRAQLLDRDPGPARLARVVCCTGVLCGLFACAPMPLPAAEPAASQVASPGSPEGGPGEPPSADPRERSSVARRRPEGAAAEARSADLITLSIVSTNDVHGRISQLPLLGGYVANLRARRASDGGAVLLLDGGDIFQGTIESNATEGAAMVRAYAALGYDAVTLGNHEFDFGPVGPHAVPELAGDDPLGALRARITQAPFPFLNANLHAAGAALLPIAKLRASVLLHPGGIAVGVIGGVTEDVLRTTHAANTRGIQVEPLSRAVAAEAERLRAEGAQIVVALVHAGGECRAFEDHMDLRSCEANAEVFRLARALSPGSVDVIVAGHTHAGLAHQVNGIAIIEAFSNGRAFGRVDLAIDRGSGAPQAVQIHAPHELCVESLDQPSCAQGASYEGRAVVREPRVLAAIADDVQRARATRERPLGVVVESPVWREYRAESPLNNLVADLMLRASPGADAAFTNAGAIRIPLPAGPLHYGTVFEMFPFDNTFATLRLSARQLGQIVAKNLLASNGILAIAGLRAIAGCDAQQVVVHLYTPAGEPIDPARRLTVVTSDFLASAGDGLLDAGLLDAGAINIARNRPIRDALLAGLRAYPGGALRGTDKQLFDPEQPRLRYPGERPVRCE